MLTHARVFVENILQQVIQAEKLPDEQWTNLKERLDLLNDNGYLTPEIRDALHHVRQIGNKAAHDTRRFRYSEALLVMGSHLYNRQMVRRSIRTRRLYCSGI